MKMKKKIVKKLFFILGLFVIAFLLMKADFKEIILNIRSISIRILSIALGLQIITMILIAIQWKTMIALSGRKVSFVDVFLVNIKGNIVDSITPGVKVGGELARIYELKKTMELDTASASVIVGLQKTISILSFLFLTLISLVWFNFTLGNEYRHYSYLFSTAVMVFILLLAILILVCIQPNIINFFLNKMPLQSKLRKKLETGLKEYHKILLRFLSKKKQFIYQLLFGVLIWGIFALKMLLIVKGFGMKISFISMAAITYLTYVLGMIPLLPGSIGSFETGMVALLSTQGVPIDIGIAISIVFRFVTFWFEFLVSLVIYIMDKIFSLYRKGDRYAKGRA